MAAIPDNLPAQIGCLGRTLMEMIQPWAECGRAAAIDSTVLRARGGVWHRKTVMLDWKGAAHLD